MVGRECAGAGARAPTPTRSAGGPHAAAGAHALGTAQHLRPVPLQLQGHLAAAPPRRGDRPGTRRAGHRVRPEHAQPRLQHLRHRRRGHGQVQHRPGPGRSPRAPAAGPGRLVPRQQLPGRVPPAGHPAAARTRAGLRQAHRAAGRRPQAGHPALLRRGGPPQASLPAEGPVRRPAAEDLRADRALRREPGAAPRLQPQGVPDPARRGRQTALAGGLPGPAARGQGGGRRGHRPRPGGDRTRRPHDRENQPASALRDRAPDGRGGLRTHAAAPAAGPQGAQGPPGGARVPGRAAGGRRRELQPLHARGPGRAPERGRAAPGAARAAAALPGQRARAPAAGRRRAGHLRNQPLLQQRLRPHRKARHHGRGEHGFHPGDGGLRCSPPTAAF